MNKSLLWNCLSHLSDESLCLVEKITMKKGIREKIDSEKFVEYILRTDFKRLDVTDRPICIIDTLDWEFPYFTFYFFNNVVANIAYCLYKGWAPYVKYIAPKRNVNLWEEFMIQPYEIPLEQINHCLAKGNYHTIKYKFAPICFPNFPTEKEIADLSNLYSFFSPTLFSKI